MNNVNTSYGVKNVKKSLGHFLLGKSISLIVGFGFFLLIARALNLEEFGFYIVLAALLEIIALLSNFGCYFIAQRYVPELMHQKSYGSLKTILRLLLVFRIMTLLIVLAICFWLTDSFLSYFNLDAGIGIFYLYLVVILFESTARFIEMIFDSLLLQGYSQISILFRNTLRFLFVLYLYLYSMENIISLKELVLIEVFTGGVGITVTLFLLIRFVYKLPKESKNEVLVLDYKRYFNYARPGYIAQVIGLTYSVQTLKLVMTKFFGLAETALFGFTSVFIAMISRYMPSMLLVGMIRPLFITAYSERDGYQKLHTLTHIVIKTNLLCILPIVIFLSVVSEELVVLLAGDKFENGGIYLFFFAMFMMIQIYHVILSQLNMASEGGSVLLKATIYSSFGVFLGLLLIPVLDEFAILLGLILSEIIFCWILFKALSKKMIINFSLFRGGKAFLLASVLSFIALTSVHYFWNTEGLLYLLALFTVVIAVFLTSLYVIKPFTESERLLINKVLPFPCFCF